VVTVVIHRLVLRPGLRLVQVVNSRRVAKECKFVTKEKSRSGAYSERLLTATAGSRPVPLLKFGEAGALKTSRASD